MEIVPTEALGSLPNANFPANHDVPLLEPVKTRAKAGVARARHTAVNVEDRIAGGCCGGARSEIRVG